MTWTSFHHRSEVLRAVIAEADASRDGLLPMQVEGVLETFGDELTLLGALTLRWHTRLAGRVERALAHDPVDVEAAVVKAWRRTAADLPGVLEILDRHRAAPLDDAMAAAVETSTAKEHALLAVMAGLSACGSPDAPAVGARLVELARTPSSPAAGLTSLVDRLKAVLTAA